MATRLNPLVMIATIRSPTRYSDVRKGEAKKLRKFRVQTSSNNVIVSCCITRVRKSHRSTAPSSAGTKLKSGMRDRIEVAGEKAPDQNIDRDEDEDGKDALRAAAIEIEHPQHDGADARGVHRAAAVVQRLLRDVDEQVVESRRRRVPSGSVFGSPSSTIRPCDRNSTRSQTACTSTCCGSSTTRRRVRCRRIWRCRRECRARSKDRSRRSAHRAEAAAGD